MQLGLAPAQIMPDPGNPDYPLTVRPLVRNLNEESNFDDAATLESIEQMLNQEEDTGDERSMLVDAFALQVMEKSFYRALKHETHPSLVYQHYCFASKDNNHGSSSSNAMVSWAEPEGMTGFNGQLDSFLSEALLENSCNESETVSLFKKGLEEAAKFLPGKNTLAIGVGNRYDQDSQPVFKGDNNPEAVLVGSRREEGESSSSKSETRTKNYEGHMGEGKSVDKLLASYKDADEDLSEVFDRLFLYCNDERECLVRTGCLKPKRTKEEGRNDESPIDLESLLIFCAQAVASDDPPSAYEWLRRIGEHSSTTGNGSQRCAHYFARGLEARLLGLRPQQKVPVSILLPTTDMEASRILVSACPFRKVDYEFTRHHLLNLAQKARTLHVIDFGILHGLRWVELMRDLSDRHGASVKLRITGIEEPQSGFLPAETGPRLVKYGERFNIPFEYNGIIAQNWEMIRFEDFNIDRRNEAVAVICLHRLEKQLDELVGVSSPRSAILDLIRKLNPNVFIHCSINGSFNSALFSTRVREALYQYSAMFDMLDTIFNRESWVRQRIEKDTLGPEILNVLACEGSQRVNRPETYRRWEKRTVRAGFRQLPLDVEHVRRLRATVKSCFHRDFLIEEDGNWLLQGWKGRTLCACCCWITAPY